MQPLGNKILVRDIIEEKKSASGLILDTMQTPFKKVSIVAVSPDSDVRVFDDKGKISKLKVGDECLSDRGGVELESGVWLCRSDLLVAKL